MIGIHKGFRADICIKSDAVLFLYFLVATQSSTCLTLVAWFAFFCISSQSW
jgi:hypothetical protein